MCILCVIALFFSLFVFLFCLFAIYLLLPYWVNKDEYIFCVICYKLMKWMYHIARPRAIL